MGKMRCFLLLAMVFLPGSLVFADAVPGEAEQFVFLVYDALEENYYDPDALDPPRLFNAALEGMAVFLKAADVEFQPRKIVPGVSGAEARQCFSAEFRRVTQKMDSAHNPISGEKLAFAAAAALLDAVKSSHTYLMVPESAEDVSFSASGYDYAGIGVQVRELENGYFYIACVLPGGPADHAGVQVFDRILAVDDLGVGGANIEELERRIRGEPGSRMVLTVEHKPANRVERMTMTREAIAPPSWFYEPRADYDYLRIFYFDTSLDSVGKCLGELRKAQRKGLVIDLRDNPGGCFSGVVDMILALFLPPRTPTYIIINKKIGIEKTIFVHNLIPGTKMTGFPPLGCPLVILVNEGSFSAAEILAAVLQKTGRVQIVGQKTAGMTGGSIIIPLPFGAAMKVTSRQIIGADGKPLEFVGVTPDATVALTRDDITSGRDSQLEKAAELLNQSR